MGSKDKSHVKADAEVTAGITLTIDSTDYTIQSLDVSKEMEMAEIRGNNIKLESTATTAIDYSGSLTFHGNKKSYFDDTLFDSSTDKPKEFSITITHGDGSSSGYSGCKVTSEGYTADEGESTETSYDFIARNETSSSGDSSGSGS